MVIILSVNGLKYIEWLNELKKKEPSKCLQETHFRCKNTQAESKGIGKGVCKW